MTHRIVSAVALGMALVLASCSDRLPLYGSHQAGIATPEQKFAFVAAFDLTTTDATEVRVLLQTWTRDAEALTQGTPLGDNASLSVPPADTGEALDLKPSKLTLTFGVGPSLFDGRFGLADKRPAALVPLPSFPKDVLKPELSYGDLVVQVGSDDYQAAYHAIHTLTRAAQGVAVARWVQAGFSPNRNLQGFKDGTVNPDITSDADMNAVVWVGQDGGWMAGGSYLVVRHIRMLVETWDRSSLSDQQRAVGRDRPNGDPLASQPETAHMRLAHGAGVERILRRPYSFVNGLDPRTGQWDSGLLFLAWMKDPGRQFVPMQMRLSNYDGLGEYLKYEGSAVFAVFPGIERGSYFGANLFPEPPVAAKVEGLLGAVGAAYPALASGDWTTVRARAAEWSTLWTKARSAAGDHQAKVDALAQAWVAALSPDAPSAADVRAAQTALARELNAWHDAAAPKAAASATDLGPLKAKLAALAQAVGSSDGAQARQAYTAFETEWLGREALVRNLDGTTYAAVEAALGSLRTALAGAAPAAGAKATVDDLRGRFDKLASPQAFGAWDAGFLLFREGLEALLVLAALLAYLGRTGQTRRRPWVWSGATLGLGASIAVAVVLSAVLAGVMASAPTLVEGLSGLVAVVLMITVGAWLHGKASIKNWNAWLKAQMGKAGESGWALGALAFLAVFREGAETVVFFWGLAGSISAADLWWGIAGALAVLTVLGVVLIGFSKRLPLGVFFPVATALVYYLAVKILGQSLGSLQTAGWLPSTSLGFGIPLDWIGFVPTWETAVPQVVLLAVLTIFVVRSMVKKPVEPTPTAT